MMVTDYKISFTTGGLFYREAIKVAELYLQLKNWSAVRDEILAGNLLQARTRSSARRNTQELLRRLWVLTDEQLELLVECSRQEQNQILWYAACKQFPFVKEFAVEVLREKFLRLDIELTYLDFDIFFNNKAEWNEALDQIAETTRKKLRQVLFRMMTEAGLISTNHLILPILLSPRVASAILNDQPDGLLIFPIAENEIRKLRSQ